jgi:hypothetical protein
VNFDSLYGHVLAVLSPIGLAAGLSGYSIRDAFRKKRTARAESPAVEREPMRALPAAELAPSPWPTIPATISYGSDVSASGAATTIGATLVTPIAAIKRTPGATFFSLPTFGTVPAGSAATA